MNFYIQKGMKHLVLVRFNQYTRIPAQYIFPAHHHGPDPLKLPPAPLYGSDPALRNSGSHPAPRHSAGSGESIPRQPGIAEMVVPVVHCRFQIRLVNEMPVTLPGNPKRLFHCLTNRFPVRHLCHAWSPAFGAEDHRQTFSPFFQLFIPGFQRLAALYCFLTAQPHHPRQLQAGCEACVDMMNPVQYLMVKCIRNGPVRPVTAGTTDTERLVAD